MFKKCFIPLHGVASGVLSHFGLATREDLPGMEELKAAGLLDRRPAISIYAGQANEESLLPADEDEDSSEEAEPLESEEDAEDAEGTEDAEEEGVVIAPFKAEEEPTA